MDVLAQFGLDGDDLPAQIESVSYPKPVQGRVAHIDADFLAYQVSAETVDEIQGLRPRKSFEDMQNNTRQAADHLMRLAGATSYHCHITPSASTKGNRDAQAVQQEYQANRADREKPEFLDKVRAFIGQELNGVVHLHQEADDGMSRANYEAIASGDRNLSVIVSKDKDLRMVPGLHLDFKTDEIVDVDGFGSIWIDESTSSKKVLGWGTAFFWAQCLMGDSADFIKGIPMVAGQSYLAVQPTKAYQTAMDQWSSADTDEKVEKASAKLGKMFEKTKTCGPVLTFDLLKDIQNDKDAFQEVKRLWEQLVTNGQHQFTHWKTGQTVTATQALLGDMQLLWMRRNDNPLDVVEWIKEQIR